MNKEKWIKTLDLEPHPEGGFFKELEPSHEFTKNEEGKERPLYTNIYFLLTDESPSHFHRLTADEIWYYHTGDPLTVHMLNEDGSYTTVTLGDNPDEGHVLQYKVPAGTIFGSTVDNKDSYALVSCMVSPGFDFEDFELFRQSDLLEKYPEHDEIIKYLAMI
ncbi:cupin domain-containing protein [Holzapfeliella sp. JNUCC 72]